jgi:hypothetical protein
MLTSAPTEGRTRSLIRRCGIALFFVVAAFVPTLLLQRLFPYPFLFLFFGAVMASAWFGGTAARLFAVLRVLSLMFTLFPELTAVRF